MVSKRKKKYSTGEGAQFLSRKQAQKKLQLNLKDFRRLCILKGIYPREPRNRKRAQKGDTGIKTLYHKKDIQFLLHEPVVWKLRDYKIFSRKLGRAKAQKDMMKIKRYLDNHPTLKLDHIVKERYPTFEDALTDLDDCLTLCFLFSTFPSMAHVPRSQSALCRRLTIEFLHAVIEAKALRKVFISIKGYYYQAEIKGQLITWIVPHHFSFEPQKTWEVDFKVMSIFVEFYVVMLGFVNYKLYNMLNMYYPPKLGGLVDNEADKSLVDEEVFVSERIASLNIPLTKSSNENVDEEVEIDTFPVEGTSEEVEKAKLEIEKVKKLKKLFVGLKFFINREVPREPLVFIIRSFGGEVSWDKDFFVGATFDETDETITHQIVDRPAMDKQYISRYYVQPQWIFDSVNVRELLPTDKYLIGKVLPPHLSPFLDADRDEREQYIPPEEKALLGKLDESNVEEEKEVIEQESDVEQEQEEELEEEQVADNHSKLKVTPGKVYKEPTWEKTKQEKQEYRLREKMVKNKHRNLYKSMMKGRQERSKAVWLLKKKRKRIEEKDKNPSKVQ